MKSPKWHSPKDEFGQYHQMLHLMEITFVCIDWDEVSDIQMMAFLEDSLQAWLKYNNCKSNRITECKN